ncbi:MAG: hypothetical protein EOP47_05205 [Sphingobacteriaceae bacterium]|nr:MAG: hypothetical protein EOP47_05205 [Sphingobacteriaceae bacterium]
MKHNSKQPINYNSCVKTAYDKILTQIETLISSIDDAPLRQVLERSNKEIKPGVIIHEFLNALVYLRLECYNENVFAIHYGYEQSDRLTKYYPVTSAFIRSVYKNTAVEYTSINIENCIRTDWVITNCAELFEYIGDRNKHHISRTIKPKPVRKKQILKVA